MSTAWLFTVPGLCSTSSVRSQWVNYDLDLGFSRQIFFTKPYVRGVGEPLDLSWKGCQLIYDFGRHLILDLELGFPRSNLKISVSEKWDGVLLAFLRWMPPSTMWAGSLIFCGHHWECLNNPTYSNLGYMLHVEHISCVITNCGQQQWVTPSLSIAGGKYYQKITVPIFRLILEFFIWTIWTLMSSEKGW